MTHLPKRWTVLAATLLLLLLATNSVPAIEEARVTGKVVDGEGKPVGGITLLFVPMNDATPETSVKVNKKGKFTHGSVPSGSYFPRVEGDQWVISHVDFVARDQGLSKVGEMSEDVAPGQQAPGFRTAPFLRATMNLVVVPREEVAEVDASALQKAQDDSPALIELNEFFEASDWAGLLAASESVLAENPELGGAYYLRAVAQWRSGLLADAVPTLRRAAELTPEQPGIQGTLASLLIEHGNLLRDEGKADEAIAAFNEAVGLLESQLELTPDSMVYIVNRVVALDSAGRVEETIAALRDLIAINPEETRAYIRLAQLLTDLGKPEEAVAALEEIPEGGMAGATAIYNAAVEMWNAGNLEATVLALDKAIGMAPEMAELYQLKGRALIAQENNEAGIEALRKYLSLVGDDEPAAEADRALVKALGGGS